MSEFLAALDLVLRVDVIVTVVCAALFGLFIGAIPGLTATMATALLVPVTFFMDAVTAIGAIVTATAMAIFAGDIPGALLRIPGTPASAAYTEEAYRMGSRGELGKALGVNLLCSALGGMVGVLILAFFASKLARFSLQFSSYEYFWLAVVGLSSAVLVSRGNPVKGGVSLLLGLLLSTVGIDAVMGYPRFTFGSVGLSGGISILPTLIGVFAIAELLRKMPEARNAPPPRPPAVGRLFAGVLPELWRYKLTAAASSVGGTLIGALPGAGADIAAWISYAVSKRFSRTPEKFGTGHPEGIVAASSANNAAISGAYVPALVFGIPGDTITAIIIGVLLMKGITPGPMVFVTDSAMVNAIFMVFFFANVLLIPLGFLAIRGARYLLRVPSGVLYPLILMFCIVGAYATNNATLDIWIMLAVGVLAYVMEENDFPVAPLILAVVLGPVVEENFMKSIIKADGELLMFFERPMAAVLGGIAIAVWGGMSLRGLWRAVRGTGDAVPGPPASDDVSG
ncbi:tripartite tricarboxylate transporter permease [Arhodomonas sp. AD133]|uniref:tripartite tricarboxylate transporter permease n=1 Tax=Arhodomonas sp. AD133 TaxID=3415009 RepID=UPI003EB74250